MKGESFFMSRHKVELTGVNTANIEVLSSEEMTKLLKEYKAGNTAVKDRLVTGNLKLVLSILKRFTKKEENMDDLFQVGVIGLIKAIDNFDLSYGLKLSTYAVPLIVGEIKRYIRDNTQMRVSRSIKDLAYKIIKFKDDYVKDHGVEAPASKISEALGIDEYQISFALDALREPTSIFEPIYNDGGDTIYLFDQIADVKDKNSDKDMLISLRKALLKLKKREKDILLERFIVGKTQMEIADSLGISQAQVSRLEKSALLNLKKQIK